MSFEAVRLFGIANEASLDVSHWYDSLDGAEAALDQVRADDPELAEVLRVAAFDIEFSRN
jgi:hypothetical protein